MTDLTPAALYRALQPLLLLPNAPELTDELYTFLLGLFQSEGVTERELQHAIVHALKTERFWAGPAVLLEAIRSEREKASAEESRRTYDERMRLRSDSNRLLGFLAEHDRELFREIQTDMHGDDLAQDAVRRLDHTERVKALLATHNIPTIEAPNAQA